LRYFSAPHHRGTALYPIITHLEQAAGFARDDPPAAKLEPIPNRIALLGEARVLFAMDSCAVRASTAITKSATSLSPTLWNSDGDALR
jgi:hypothetical protein